MVFVTDGVIQPLPGVPAKTSSWTIALGMDRAGTARTIADARSIIGRIREDARASVAGCGLRSVQPVQGVCAAVGLRPAHRPARASSVRLLYLGLARKAATTAAFRSP